DVFVLIDSLTRMCRAFNTERGRGGRAIAAGLDAGSLQKPREIVSSARYHELKSSPTAEVVLSRELADKRIFPAIDVKASGTRKEERLRASDEMRLMSTLRRQLIRHTPEKALLSILERLRQTQNNAEFLLQLHKAGV